VKHVSAFGKTKVRYIHYENAKAEAEQQTREKGMPYAAYLCPCQCWHIGRVSKTWWARHVERAKFLEDEWTLGVRVASILSQQNNGNEQHRTAVIVAMGKVLERKRRQNER